MDEDEELDLVDVNDQVVGTILRSNYENMVKQNLGYIRAADAFLINSDGKLWIPRRREHKRIVPNGLDFSMGEHVKAGETYMEACIRGFNEELNLHVKESELVTVTKFAPEPGLPAYFQTLFLYQSNRTPRYNLEDFSEYYWLTPTELIRIIKNGELAKSNLIRSAEYLLQNYLR